MLVVKNLPARRRKRHGFNPWAEKIPWRRAWQPTQVFLPGESPRTGGWGTTVYRVAQSQTWLKQLSKHTHILTALVSVSRFPCDRKAWHRFNKQRWRDRERHQNLLIRLVWSHRKGIVLIDLRTRQENFKSLHWSLTWVQPGSDGLNTSSSVLENGSSRGKGGQKYIPGLGWGRVSLWLSGSGSWVNWWSCPLHDLLEPPHLLKGSYSLTRPTFCGVPWALSQVLHQLRSSSGSYLAALEADNTAAVEEHTRENTDQNDCHRELCSMLRGQLGWEGSLGENAYMYVYGWVPLLSTWNYHNIVNHLYSKIKS